MSNKIDLIMSSVQQFCREGYLLPKERQTLFDLAELHGIDKAELEAVLNAELEKVRAGRLENLYKVAKQPDAALSDKPELFQQSRRQFPDMLKLGTLKLKLNPKVTAPAFVPLKDMAGLCIIHDNNPEMVCSIIQNVVMRIMLSVPRSLTRVTIVDPASMGADYIGLSGIDGHLLKVIDDEKKVQPFLQAVSRESASFNFNELGSTFADIAEYNRTNRSKAHPYQIIIVSDFPSMMDKSILPEIKKIVKLAQKTGVFFLFALDQQQLDDMPEMLDAFILRQDERPKLCIIDTVKKELIAEQSDEVEFFNNAFDFEIDKELMFTSDTILQFNHEFDPNTYKLGVTEDSGDYSIESLNMVVGKMPNKDKAYIVQLQHSHDNILAVSQDEYALESMAVGMLRSMTKTYKRSELDYVFYNCGFIPENLASANMVANIHTDKLHYLHGLLKHIESMVASRKDLFQQANVSEYESYRNAVETTLPRLVCFVNVIDGLLDSESMSDIESVMLLDQLLNEAGRYGIHFLLFGKPSVNLFKLNLSEYVRYKLFHALTEEECMRIGILSSNEDLDHQNHPNGSILYDANQAVSIRLELVAVDGDVVKDALGAFAAEEEPLSYAKTLVDKGEQFPDIYRAINAENIAEKCLNNAVPIGIMRGFAEQFASIGHENVMIVGDDADGEQSILRSVYVTLKRTGRLSGMSVFDACGSHPMGLPGMQGVNVYSDLGVLPVAENGIVCMLHTEALDTLYINKVEDLLAQARQKQAQVLLFAKNDLASLGVSAASFTTKIALCGVREGFISPVYFYTNEALSLPKTSMQALCERIDVSGGMVINAMWLFNY